MGKRKRVLSLMCIVCLLASLILSGCDDHPDGKEIESILAKTDPVIEEALASAYGFTPGKDYLSEGSVSYSRMAEYTFEVNGIRHKAAVDPYSPELITYSDYYTKEFTDLFEGKILDGINDLDLFSGCEYEVYSFSFRDSTPKEHNPRYSGNDGMLPTFVTPDNLNEYLAASDVSPLNLNIELYYYGPADVHVSEEKVNLIWKDFYRLGYGDMRINHYESRRTIDFKCLLEEYYIYPHVSSFGHTEFSYLDLTDGVTVRCQAGKEDGFEYYVNGNTLHVNAPSSSYEYLLHISDDRISRGDKYYELYTDANGNRKKNSYNWLDHDIYVNGEYSIPLR